MDWDHPAGPGYRLTFLQYILRGTVPVRWRSTQRQAVKLARSMRGDHQVNLVFCQHLNHEGIAFNANVQGKLRINRANSVEKEG